MLGVSRCDLQGTLRALAQPHLGLGISAAGHRTADGEITSSPIANSDEHSQGWRGQAYRAGRAVIRASHTTIRSARRQPPGAGAGG